MARKSKRTAGTAPSYSLDVVGIQWFKEQTADYCKVQPPRKFVLYRGTEKAGDEAENLDEVALLELGIKDLLETAGFAEQQ